MGNYFWRRPIEGGDENNWAYYNDAHIHSLTGLCTCKLYNDAGTLKISKGRIGIDDGTNKGISVIDTITTISLLPITNGNWAKIEMSVSGTSVTFTASDTDTGVDNDWDTLPPDFLSSFDNEKQGYYISVNKRCIGVIKLDGSGDLEGIINVRNCEEGYSGYSYYDDGEDAQIIWNVHKDSFYAAGWAYYSGWNMDTDDAIILGFTLGNSLLDVIECNAMVISNNGQHRININGQGALGQGGYVDIHTSSVGRVAGGWFDDATYNDADVYITWKYKE